MDNEPFQLIQGRHRGALRPWFTRMAQHLAQTNRPQEVAQQWKEAETDLPLLIELSKRLHNDTGIDEFVEWAHVYVIRSRSTVPLTRVLTAFLERVVDCSGVHFP